MEKAPFFSVITPVYNRTHIIRETIGTVLAQDFSDFEYILVDDKSTDDSLEICREYSNRDDRIKVVALPKNKGRCLARNNGIETATGQWVCFLDSDDTYLPHHLSTLKRLIEEFPEYKAFAANQLVDNKPKAYSGGDFINGKKRIEEKDLWTRNPIQLNQLCYQRDLPVIFPPHRRPYGEDWYFTRILAHISPVLMTDEITSELNHHDSRSMIDIDLVIFTDSNVKCAFHYLDDVKADHALRNKIISFTYLYCANILLSGKHKKEGINYIKQALSFRSSFSSSLLYKAVAKILFKR